MDSDIRIFWVEGLQKKGILTFFLSFFDQVWKMVVYNVYIYMNCWHIFWKFWRNKLFCQYHKPNLFFIWLYLINKLPVMPFPPCCCLKLFFLRKNIYESDKRYKFIKIRIWKYPFFLTLNSLSFYVISNEWIILCTYNKVFCHTALHANKLWI